jgi:hypothetical protein
VIEVVPGGPWDYSQPDPAELPEKMMTSIILGTDMDDSGLVTNDEERAMWRAIARSIAWVQQQGLMPVYEFGRLDDDDVE